MKTAIWLILPLALLTACLFDGKDDKVDTIEHTFTGPLANLDQIEDPTYRYHRWRLRVDLADDPVLRGTCDYDGYLGDSASVNGESTEGLYTHTAMGGSGTAEYLRREGVILAMDTTESMDTLTHYRADFRCRD